MLGCAESIYYVIRGYVVEIFIVFQGWPIKLELSFYLINFITFVNFDIRILVGFNQFKVPGEIIRRAASVYCLISKKKGSC